MRRRARQRRLAIWLVGVAAGWLTARATFLLVLALGLMMWIGGPNPARLLAERMMEEGATGRLALLVAALLAGLAYAAWFVILVGRRALRPGRKERP